MISAPFTSVAISDKEEKADKEQEKQPKKA